MELERMLDTADSAAPGFALTSPDVRAGLLVALADALDTRGPELVVQAMAETGLGEPRLTGEVARTSHQLRHLAEVVRDGGYLEVIIDKAGPDAAPDLRRWLSSVGPVLVFAASNFPFAFGVLGGDTASALACGSPVVVKAHPSHPGLSVAVATLAETVIREAGLHPGLFALVVGDEQGVVALRDSRIKASGFTGSTAGGRFLFDLANSRPDPIPFFGELGSLNPVVVSPLAVAARGGSQIREFLSSMTGSTGQLCTKPGALFLPAGHGLEDELSLCRIGGSLTATLHAETGDADTIRPVADLLARMAGRVIHNGWPTGVAVTWAVNHGGPWPASTNAAHTSVGATSIRRWLRPVCFQDTPQVLLPPALTDENPWRVPQQRNLTVKGRT